MSKTSEKMARWKYLDSILAGPVPVSQRGIMELYQSNNELRLIDKSAYDRMKTRKDREEALDRAYLPTLRKDLTLFRNTLEKNGLNGALIVSRGAVDKQWEEGRDMRTKLFRYRDPGFTIIPLLTREMSDSEYRSLVSAVGKLRGELPGQIYDDVRFSILSRVESDYGKGMNCVEYEDNRQLKGRQYRPLIYQAIIEKSILHVRYRNFKGAFFEFDFHPYLLKQYNERWFAFGLRPDKRNPYTNVPLDRLDSAPVIVGTYQEYRPENYSLHFSDIVGVTKYRDAKTEHVVIGVSDIDTWGRVTTKPFPTQKVVKEFDAESSYGQLSLDIVPNIELYMNVLSCGKGVVIESPEEIRNTMREFVETIAGQYK